MNNHAARTYYTLTDAKASGAIAFEWTPTAVIALDHAGIPLAVLLTESDTDHVYWRRDMEHELAMDLGIVRPEHWK